MTPASRISAQAIVADAAVASEHHYALTDANIYFVNRALGTQTILSDHLQPETLMSYYLDYYLGEVSNGGHEQFVRNMAVSSKVPWRHSQRMIDPIAAALERLKAPRTAAVFRMVRDRLDKDHALMIGARNRGGFDDDYYGKVAPWLREADHKHYEAVRAEQIRQRNSAFVRSWPSLIVVPNGEVDAAIAKLIANEPNLKQMSTEREAFISTLEDESARRRQRLGQIISESLGISVTSDAKEQTFDFKSFSNRRREFSWHTGYALATPEGLLTVVLEGNRLYLLRVDAPSFRELAVRKATKVDKNLFAV